MKIKRFRKRKVNEALRQRIHLVLREIDKRCLILQHYHKSITSCDERLYSFSARVKEDLYTYIFKE